MNTIDEASQLEPPPREVAGHADVPDPGSERPSQMGLSRNSDKPLATPQPDLFDDPATGPDDIGAREQTSTRRGSRIAADGIERQANIQSGRVAPDQSVQSATQISATEAASANARSNQNATQMDPDSAINLDARMAGSQLKELGWRNRPELAKLMADLERLAHASWKKAANLWDKYRPDDLDKPIFIAGDDKDTPPSTAPLRAIDKNLQREESDTPSAGRIDKSGGSDATVTAIPPSVKKRYLVADNKFYFRDDPNLVAFEDKGKRLATEHNDPMVAKSMVELAQTKHWNAIKVSGADEFRREVWFVASLRNLAIRGYDPSAVDLAKLEELRNALRTEPKNTIQEDVRREKPSTSIPSIAPEDEHAVDRSLVDINNNFRNLSKQQRVAVDTLRAILTERGDSATAIEMTAQLAIEKFLNQRVYVGRLLDHGEAPYENRNGQSPNYFLKLKTAHGERTIWGVDLERGVVDGRLQRGDDVVLIHRGWKPVTVATRERDETGAYTGQQVDLVVNRNTWEAGKLDTLRDTARRNAGEAERHGELNQPIVNVVASRPLGKSAANDQAKAQSVELQPQR